MGKSLSKVPGLEERSEHELFPGDCLPCTIMTVSVLLPLLLLLPLLRAERKGERKRGDFTQWFAKLSSNVQTAGELGWFLFACLFYFLAKFGKRLTLRKKKSGVFI